MDPNPSMIYTGFNRKDFFHMFPFDGVVFAFSKETSHDISSWYILAGDRRTFLWAFTHQRVLREGWYLVRSTGDKWCRHIAARVLSSFWAHGALSILIKQKNFMCPSFPGLFLPPTPCPLLLEGKCIGGRSQTFSWLSELAEPTSWVACNLKQERGEKRLTWIM